MSETLSDAVQSGDLDTLRAADRAALSAAAPGERSPLTLAAELGDIEVVECLLGAGALPDTVDGTGEVALHVAARSDQPMLAALLLSSGASAAVTDRVGLTPSETAAASGALRVLRELEVASRSTVSGWEQRVRRAAADPEAVSAFLSGAPDREKYRSTRGYLTHSSMLNQARDRRAKLSAAKQAREAEQAPVLPALPPSGTMARGDDHHPLHRRLCAALGPLLIDELEEMLHHHAEMLASGAGDWLGGWDRWQSGNVQIGVSTGPLGRSGRRLDLMTRDLRQLVLCDLDLRVAHAPGMMADGVDFSRSDLSGLFAVWTTANSACFADARLIRADFSQSDFRGADFRGADLTLTDFQDCDLRDADLRGAVLRGTLFKNTDLTGARF